MADPIEPEEEKSQGTIKIENNELVIRVSLLQKHGKYLAKGLLMDAINVVDEYFFILKQKELQSRAAIMKNQKTVIDSIIKPNNGRVH